MEKKSPLAGMVSVSSVLLGDEHSTVQCDAEGRILGRCRYCDAPGIVVVEPTPDQARINRLELALQFYANEQNWMSEVEGQRVVLHRIPKHESSMDRDQGAIARAALEAVHPGQETV